MMMIMSLRETKIDCTLKIKTVHNHYVLDCSLRDDDDDDDGISITVA